MLLHNFEWCITLVLEKKTWLRFYEFISNGILFDTILTSICAWHKLLEINNISSASCSPYILKLTHVCYNKSVLRVKTHSPPPLCTAFHFNLAYRVLLHFNLAYRVLLHFNFAYRILLHFNLAYRVLFHFNLAYCVQPCFGLAYCIPFNNKNNLFWHTVCCMHRHKHSCKH